ncbi:histidyl-tRNA synthetase [Microcella putealis]|uniref:Histidine--tRNA ligase n=1 Tax=Microcella putealis TaxID=337005 RepID=A0A4Q7LYH7_9MICO|nr:histidine--tRNA ligase [Microcella putealis]RZS59593.1 histidyl-tRNA synthetase [Microcella putealis]TQM26706.1 histidyl-tRNA synthetase [Microcella putealis]
MPSPVTPPRGMRDILPADKARREALLATIRDTYRRHGFDEIETPVMEDSSRLHAGLGGDNEKLAFAVMKRGLTTDELRSAATPLELADLGLRFDLTVPLARFYASNRAELPSVFRAIQIAPVWRAERPQKGRYRQFVQCDIDIIGEPGVFAEIELITATVDALAALGVPGCTIRINDRRLLTSMLATLGFPAGEGEAVLITLDKLDKIGVDGVLAELRERGMPEAAVAALAEVPALVAAKAGESATTAVTAEAIRASLPDGIDETAVSDLAEIAAAVGEGVPLAFDPFLVRGMGYYTGPIFEVAHPEFGYSLGGGGRYDGMIGRFAGTDVAACGFSLGFERLVDLVTTVEDARGGSALIVDKDVAPADTISLKRALVEGGERVRVVTRAKNMRALLERLEADGYTRSATVRAGERDAATLQWRALGE